MPSGTFFGMQHLNSNLLCTVCTDMTGPDPNVHELIEICLLPLDKFLQPHPEILLYNIRMAPLNKEDINYGYCRLGRDEIARAVLSGIDQHKGADLLDQWFDQLQMNRDKKIIPVSHTWPIHRERLINWLGYANFARIFSEDYRDPRICAHFLNDKAACSSQVVPFSKQDFRWLAKVLDITSLEHNRNCVEDCRQLAEIYKRMLQY